MSGDVSHRAFFVFAFYLLCRMHLMHIEWGGEGKTRQCLPAESRGQKSSDCLFALSLKRKARKNLEDTTPSV